MSASPSTPLNVVSRTLQAQSAEAFMAPLNEIGVFEPSNLPAPAARRTTFQQQGARRASRSWLPRWLRRREEPEAAPDAAPQTAPPRITTAKQVQDLLKGLADLTNDRPNKDVERIVRDLAASSQSADTQAEGHVTLESSPDGKFHRLTLRSLRFANGPNKLDALDISGLKANVALRLENCELDVLDASHAHLYSINLKGCGPAKDSPLAPWGMRVFARNLHLDDDLMIGQGRLPTRILMLDASGAVTQEIQIVDGTVFKGGQLAREIWERLLERLSDRPAKVGHNAADDPLAGLDAESLIAIHTVAARDVLRTLSLIGARADKIIISINSYGIVDLHDAVVGAQVLIDADHENRIENLDVLPITKDHLESTPIGAAAREALLYNARFLSTKLSPCLDLGGLRCSGELRFDGPETGRRGPSKSLPVRGHINLVNAHCRSYMDDKSWLEFAQLEYDADPDRKKRRRRLTYSLNSFHYDFLGNSTRLLSDSDPEFSRSRWFEWPRAIPHGSDLVAGEAVIRQRDRMVGLGLRQAEPREELTARLSLWPRAQAAGEGKSAELRPFEVSSLKLVGIDKKKIREEKVAWLKAASPHKNDDAELPQHAMEPFDAQPWTHCARVFRRNGDRARADDILWARECELHKNDKKFWPAVVGALMAGSFLLAAVAADRPAEQMYFCAAVALFGLSLVAGTLLIKWREDKPFSVLFYAILKITSGYGFKPEWALIQCVAIVAAASAWFALAREGNIIMNPAANNDGAAWESKLGSTDKPDANAAKAVATPSALPTVDQTLEYLASTTDNWFRPSSARDYRDCEGYDRAQCSQDAPSAGEARADNEPAPAKDVIIDINISGNKLITENAKSGGPYPDFNAVMFTLDLFIPFADFGQATFWYPGRNGGTHVGGDWLLTGTWFLYWFVVAAGWLYTTVLLANLSGFLERKE